MKFFPRKSSSGRSASETITTVDARDAEERTEAALEAGTISSYGRNSPDSRMDGSQDIEGPFAPGTIRLERGEFHHNAPVPQSLSLTRDKLAFLQVQEMAI